MGKILKRFDRICIREWSISDSIQYSGIVGDPSVMKYIGNGSTRGIEIAEKEILGFQAENAREGWSRWAVSLDDNGPLIGYAGFSRKFYGIDFGMRFARPYWGHPATYISCCLALEHGFEEAGLSEICTMTHPDHTRGLAFMKKLFSMKPIDEENELGRFQMYVVSRQQYLKSEMNKNRKRMQEVLEIPEVLFDASPRLQLAA
ncbi:GNAT family N-acetyltransferase [Ottowia thiooxydans]|uniref:RimJ/RimL family protein N-acetyltransferase n=1 Tax=Ottowia thiooxydans TaxID=219182 RepID=A0ABV2QBI9_9BURK